VVSSSFSTMTVHRAPAPSPRSDQPLRRFQHRQPPLVGGFSATIVATGMATPLLPRPRPQKTHRHFRVITAQRFACCTPHSATTTSWIPDTLLETSALMMPQAQEPPHYNEPFRLLLTPSFNSAATVSLTGTFTTTLLCVRVPA